MPNEIFTRESLEHKIIDSALQQYEMFKKCSRESPNGIQNRGIQNRGEGLNNNDNESESEQYNLWKSICDLNRFRPLLYHWNYCTQRGRDFCTRIRRALQ